MNDFIVKLPKGCFVDFEYPDWSGEKSKIKNKTTKDYILYKEEMFFDNIYKLHEKLNKKSELSSFVMKYHLDKYKKSIGFERINDLIRILDITKIYKIKPFKK